MIGRMAHSSLTILTYTSLQLCCAQRTRVWLYMCGKHRSVTTGNTCVSFTLSVFVCSLLNWFVPSPKSNAYQPTGENIHSFVLWVSAYVRRALLLLLFYHPIRLVSSLWVCVCVHFILFFSLLCASHFCCRYCRCHSCLAHCTDLLFGIQRHRSVWVQ